tara:strand:- start:1149 stop:1391 length:243 start_codon:yes stop_codon:yes gene_type:complete
LAHTSQATSDSNIYFFHYKIRYEIIIIDTTIIDQIDKFLINCFKFELDLKKLGRTRIKTAIKKIAGIICSNPIFNYSKNF